MRPHIFEGKYELDSLVSFLKLSERYYFSTNDLSCFAGVDGGKKWRDTIDLILTTMELEQRSTEEEGEHFPYCFQRKTYDGHCTFISLFYLQHQLFKKKDETLFSSREGEDPQRERGW